MRLIWANAARVSIVNGIGGAFTFLGAIFICAATVFICWFLMEDLDPYKSELNSNFWPLFFIFIISYTIGGLFLAVYGMAIDSILLCFMHDEEIAVGRGGKPAHCPDTLAQFFDE